MKLISKEIDTNEEEITSVIKEDVTVTYKYYEIALNNNSVDSVDTIEEAEVLVNKVKEENEDQELYLSIIEKYTDNIEEINTIELDIAEIDIQEKVKEKIEEEKKQKEEEDRINSMPTVNDIKLAYTPVSGTITSRYGEVSRIRSSKHTGTDIAAPVGTLVKTVASGTVTFASYNGSYGNLIKIKHSDEVETWYAHLNKMYVSVGQSVLAGELVGEVGSTGNSTGSHLHFEIRINGNHINPQNYLYK